MNENETIHSSGCIGGYMPEPNRLRIDRSKITEYLLNEQHPKGGAKANFFMKVGFSVENWEELQSALRTHAANNKISNIVTSAHGKKSIVECLLETPSKKQYCIRVVWNDHVDGEPPRLITAHPLS